jgi:hypothetical protein
MKKEKVPIMDIYLAGYLTMQGIPPELTLQGTRVCFEFPATKEVYKHAKDYNDNPDVPILNFVATVRRLRAQMLAGRGDRK